MIRNRTFMMGLGLGIVAGAVLLQLMLIGQGAQLTKASLTGELTKEELQAAAEAMDMQVLDKSEELLTAEQWKQKQLSEETSEGGEQPKADEQDKPSEPADNTGTDKRKTPKQPKQPDQPEAAKTKEMQQAAAPSEPKAPAKANAPITVRVPAGNNLSDVADSLLAAGVIKDRQGFIDKATEKRINRFIQSGTYTFTAGEDYGSIITKITAKPSN
ncbi:MULTISPECIES: hypothetical protein [Paenibacillus]|jgi:outer membrane biosynthesis protein TonB|uniref:Aminodeoxychorismate lyase n=2 Tax=Paenibacillus lactis TaxID=228574 RepID=G4HBL9_9BACL|nr:hypothetical protein [Paenibacillus lactis]EHB67328.1 aminodeoxychorismate lyase [Paenibacillus lactis 154]MBP1894583.1 outer membrane biosynthesis protein TonB [Paenibacillus lactis]MCM3496039.1 hypothetical protein [Paenibacillus lactis]GIO93322.1 hypothetical protein J31TS3_45490 [Paenibacillus lactis]HAF98569.1 hypothetical protein [Paenibacillus lactis]